MSPAGAQLLTWPQGPVGPSEAWRALRARGPACSAIVHQSFARRVSLQEALHPTTSFNQCRVAYVNPRSCCWPEAATRKMVMWAMRNGGCWPVRPAGATRHRGDEQHRDLDWMLVTDSQPPISLSHRANNSSPPRRLRQPESRSPKARTCTGKMLRIVGA